MTSVKRHRWGIWAKQIATIVVLLFLAWYVARHWEHMTALLKLKAGDLAGLFLLYALSTLVTAWIGNCLLSILGVGAPLSEMFLLQNVVFLLNYTPMKLGTIYRANYLRKYHGLSLGQFGALTLATTFLATTAAALCGILALTFVYGWSSPQKLMLGLSQLAILLVALAALFFPLPEFSGQGLLARMSREFKAGRKVVQSHPKTLLECTLMSVGTFILTSLRLWVIFSSIGQSLHPADYLILGAVGYVTIFVAFTPGGVGVREFLLGAVSTLIGIPMEVGILVAMIDRGIVMSYTLLAGGGSLFVLQRLSLFRPKVNSPAS